MHFFFLFLGLVMYNFNVFYYMFYLKLTFLSEIERNSRLLLQVLKSDPLAARSRLRKEPQIFLISFSHGQHSAYHLPKPFCCIFSSSRQRSANSTANVRENQSQVFILYPRINCSQFMHKLKRRSCVFHQVPWTFLHNNGSSSLSACL